MQYLSKAYNYCTSSEAKLTVDSGINPATLSGAIDVIVVRHVDETGVETLSSSPFHVRFGKLQVLRAGEKRVTIKLPNNLPEPHVAPFSMKVGETGEAFFVLETDEEVPPDLLTSPVVMPAEETDIPHTHVPVHEEQKTFATNEPFGDTEKPYQEGKSELDTDVLDLYDSTATVQSPQMHSEETPEPRETQAELPKRNKKLTETSPEEVPEVDATTAGPEVVYGKDVVFDMAGYHSHQDISRPLTPKPVQTESTTLLARDLEEAARALTERPPVLHRSSEPMDDASDADSEPDIGSLQIEHDRHVRATSEPPATPPRIARPTNGAIFPPSSPTTSAMDLAWDWSSRKPAKLKNVEENPSLFVLETERTTHLFELALCGTILAPEGQPELEGAFLQSRITFQRFIEDPNLVDDPNLVVRYGNTYVTWSTGYDLLLALSMYRRALLPPASSGAETTVAPRATGYGWSRWWRRQEPSTEPPPPPNVAPPVEPQKHYAKTLRLSSDQLKQLNLHKGANTIQFSVTSSYSGFAVCSARIFLWESTDQVVISDIDGTITKSDALGHVFAAIGRDWTHLGIARLYTDIANNGYKIIYLTSRAIGQADTTREYLRSINQGEYRMPEGPVIMSPDRLMASLHREVIMRKPELFKMACLRDIQRLFGQEAKAAFYAGFGNRITDAMSYRSVGVPPSKIYTIDSTGVVKTELLQTAGHKGSYILLNDLVNEVFPPVARKVKPEFSDFNYWRNDIPDIPIPDLSPPSPALSARSDSSMLSKIIGRRSSRPVMRPSSPLSDTSDDEGPEGYTHSRRSSMPGGFDDYIEQGDVEARPVDYDDDEQFDDDILAAGEMRNVPF